MLSKLSLLLGNSSSRNWKIEDFSGVDQLHLVGIPATLALLDWLPSSAKDGLDIGCGLVGTPLLIYI